MLLKEVRIKNFRSIADLTIEFNPKCRILVGINESGKTNILKALSMLSKEIMPTKDDIRVPGEDEPPIGESYVNFFFYLEKKDVDDLVAGVKKRVLFNKNIPILEIDKTAITIEDLCVNFEGIYKVNLLSLNKASTYRKFPDTYAVCKEWKKLSNSCPANFVVSREGADIRLNTYALVNTIDYPIAEPYLDEVSPHEINSLIAAAFKEIIETRLPETIFWTYKDENLLPARLNLDQFTASPSMCKPLKNMFELAQINDIPKTIKQEKEAQRHGLRNILNRVASKTTKQFHTVWKEYENIEFKLMPEGADIAISVLDKYNHFEFGNRSDGFKRFITFLLMISERVEAGNLQNSLIIIDEPDTNLHPSGAKYLRDELIKISEKNFVIYSTHSIFMIDRENIGRHLIVKKQKEITSADDVNESNIVDEEVIYNAIGTSIFESLKKKNIIFEGWRDKKLFHVALEAVPVEYEKIKTSMDEIGCCHAVGVTDIPKITPLLQLANRECFILSDDDEVAKRCQAEYEKNKGYGTWKRYSELDPTITAVTGEDFIKAEAFQPIILRLRTKYSALKELSDSELLNTNGKIFAFKKWLKGNVGSDGEKGIIDLIKKEVFENLKPAHIEQNYYNLLFKILEQI